MTDASTPPASLHPRLDEGMERTAITLVVIAVVALLAFLGSCLPSRSNESPRWVRYLRHWANSALKDFVRIFPDSLDGPLLKLTNYLNELRRQAPRP
jgi:hypothetical protein